MRFVRGTFKHCSVDFVSSKITQEEQYVHFCRYSLLDLRMDPGLAEIVVHESMGQRTNVNDDECHSITGFGVMHCLDEVDARGLESGDVCWPFARERLARRSSPRNFRVTKCPSTPNALQTWR